MDAELPNMTQQSDEAPIPFARPSITDREVEAVTEVLRSGWLTTGPRAKAFEAAFAARVGARHAVALNSATAALHLALEALEVGAGDEVIVPTWTFTSSGEVVSYVGARPRLIDVDPASLNATVEGVLDAVTERTRAVVAVHFAGRPLEVGRLVDELSPRGIAVIEDAAHAFPSRLPEVAGRYAGQIGAAGAFSFYATKTITTGEGGMLVTDRDDIAERARTMSLHGISRDAWNRYAADGSWSYDVVAPGFKYNLTDIAAALGLVQLDRADELLDERRRLVDRYRAAFLAADAADLLDVPQDAPGHAWHLFVIRLRLEAINVDRATVIADLQARGIGTSVHFIPLHAHPYYRDHVVLPVDRFPVADAEFPRVISLPLWPGLSDADLDRVVEELVGILGRARR
jgi:dTDP-4-amino-4,6-dideoxygalactose transaminase